MGPANSRCVPLRWAPSVDRCNLDGRVWRETFCDGHLKAGQAVSMDRDEQAVQGDRSDGDAFSAEGRRTADSTEGAMGEAPLSQGPDDGVERPAPQPCIRMIIEQLDMHNFKSYAGMRTIGPFHKRFSSIVGPNGSKLPRASSCAFLTHCRWEK